jgi:hypothetical protein
MKKNRSHDPNLFKGRQKEQVQGITRTKTLVDIELDAESDFDEDIEPIEEQNESDGSFKSDDSLIEEQSKIKNTSIIENE